MTDQLLFDGYDIIDDDVEIQRVELLGCKHLRKIEGVNYEIKRLN